MAQRKPKRRSSQARGSGAGQPGEGRGGSGRGPGSRQRSTRSGPSRQRRTDDGAAPADRGRPRRRRPRGLGGDQVEGRQAVRELLLAGRRRVDEVLMIDDLADADVLADIEALSQELGVTLRQVSRRHLAAEALTESHQGVIARAAPSAMPASTACGPIPRPSWSCWTG